MQVPVSNLPVTADSDLEQDLERMESRNSSPVIATTQLVPNANTTPVTSPNTDTVKDTVPVAFPAPQPSHEAIAMRSHQTRKANVLSLNACICGVTITNLEIQDNKAVMKCQVPGCETVWVSEPSISMTFADLLFLVPYDMHGL
jgi:hypothetical protein